MLVLSRRVGESIRIGEAVIKIGSVKGKNVSLVIDAPKEVEVRRVKWEPKVKGEAQCPAH